MILLDHLSRRKTRPIACVSATKTNCYLEQTWLKKTNQVKERQNDKDKMENRAENFLISWLKTFICPDNLQAWVLNSIKVKTWVLSLPTQILYTGTANCKYWPSWCWRCVDCRPPHCICCKLGPGTWRRVRGSSHGWLLRGVWLILPHNTSRVTCSLSTYSCAPRRWWGRRCRKRASRQGRRPCGAAAQVSARGSHHTRSSRGQGLGRKGIKQRPFLDLGCHNCKSKTRPIIFSYIIYNYTTRESKQLPGYYSLWWTPIRFSQPPPNTNSHYRFPSLYF